MYILSEQQIDFILNDIKIRGVEMEDLQLNLLDHICCIVEYELEPGGNFEHFYQKTIPRFFKKDRYRTRCNIQISTLAGCQYNAHVRSNTDQLCVFTFDVYAEAA